MSRVSEGGQVIEGGRVSEGGRVIDGGRVFEQQGYVVLQSVIAPGLADFLSGYAAHIAAKGRTVHDKQVPGAEAGYGDVLMDELLVKLLPVIEKASGRSLYPTYSYFRVYRNGDVLTRHKDRHACEISVSVCLGYQAAEPWPLFVEGPAGTCGVNLQRGDGLLYKGMECPHWREPFMGESAAQVFLHYVDQNGPCADWRYDRRTAPGGWSH